jgi:hypothetical protein
VIDRQGTDATPLLIDPSFVAVVDIALVFVIFKGDVRIT